ncbi:DUF1570 domain-containing protein [Lignipirellula cremea]|uniref:DUF1570 domain-containing protein n=1 Tax=Lignipirellula cremea TaxID=2528010 RepID=A0A518E087_9BACT|nr:DUF1570 domain-containing protein [Lignipirellula cremea]QDU97497.1 hypothetical protein Pla8534_53450 [Lignipirellula cremea]
MSTLALPLRGWIDNSPWRHSHGVATCLLALLAMLLPAAAFAQGWPAERQTGIFICHANFSLLDYEPLLNQLGQHEREITAALHLPRADEPIHLFLFDSSRTYRGYMAKHFPELPARRAMYIKNGGPGMVFAYLDNAFETDVRHESTHAVLHSVLPVVPLWLDEGLAEYFEAAPADRLHQNPHMTPVKWEVRLTGVTSVARLDTLQELTDLGTDEYRHAWAWVHFMLHGPREAREELLAYLADLESHTPTPPLSVRLARRLPNLDRRLAEHFKSWKN